MRMTVLAIVAALSCAPACADQGSCAVAQGAAIVGTGGEIVVAKGLQEACEEGRVVSLPSNSIFVISHVCDFSKSIYLAPSGQAVCVVRKADDPSLYRH
jgi:hypothetical protein